MMTGSAMVYIYILNTNDKNPYFQPLLQRAEVIRFFISIFIWFLETKFIVRII